MNTTFYRIDEIYIDYLKQAEIDARGFTTVPNVSYANNDKFVFGTVLDIDNISYFVPVSSYDKNQADNMLIQVKDKGNIKTVGSLRFNYMIPVPVKCLKPLDFSALSPDYRMLVEKELRFCKKNKAAIFKKVEKTYYRVLNKVNDELTRNSCDFKLLEIKCKEYN